MVMTMQENIFEDKNLDALLSDIKRRILTNNYEIDDDGMIVFGGSLGVKAGGVFDINAGRHEQVIRAIESGDKDAEAYWRAKALAASYYTRDGWHDIDKAKSPNLIPDAGINFLLGVLVGASMKKTAWYASAFSSNSTPNSTWDANWAGASSGPAAIEIGASETTASSRLLCTFGVPVAKSITMPTAVSYTIDAGVTNLAVYGATLNSVNNFGYNTPYEAPNGAVLLAATRRSSPITGLAEGDLINIAYTLSGSST